MKKLLIINDQYFESITFTNNDTDISINSDQIKYDYFLDDGK